ncbi:hypothetical protein AB0M46_07200 [Dactylosporangium sp. NPDC051485]|uniref:hypothetical protein n=1 Tax=Dactylosporangium sp. NPDC051485 TaxID=3154846 RepID=UPI00342A22B9
MADETEEAPAPIPADEFDAGDVGVELGVELDGELGVEDEKPAEGEEVAEPAKPEPAKSALDSVASLSSRQSIGGIEGKQPEGGPGSAEDGGGRYDNMPEEMRAVAAGRETLNEAHVNRGAIGQGDHSQNNYYEHQYNEYISFGGRQLTVQKATFGAGYVAREIETYVPVDRVGDMLAELRGRHLVVLGGAPGSGRTTTGLYLLERAGCDPARIGTLEVDDENIFAVLYDEVTLEPGQGFVIERAGRPMRANSVEALRQRATDSGAFLVIVDGPEPGPFTVARPDGAEVLDRHLEVRLRRHRADCYAGCDEMSLLRYRRRVRDDPAVRARLLLTRSVSDVVRLLVAPLTRPDVVHSGKPLDDVDPAWDDALRNLAKELLQAPPSDPAKPQLVPHQQAFRISYAVFHGLPLSYVFQAAELLSQKIMPLYEVRESAPAHLIFDASLDTLIDQRMVAAQPAEVAADGAPRTAQLSDVRLLGSLLEVAWHDYDTLRRPIMLWLQVLGGSPIAQVRVRAGQIVGLLAAFDFAEVYATVIRVWAGWQVQYRFSAAAAMDQAYRAKGLAERVHGQVDAWAGSSDPQLQDAAARSYGLDIGTADVPHAIKMIAWLGGRSGLATSNAVSVAMGWLFLNGGGDLVMREISEWISSENQHLRQHAVRVLVILARYAGSAGLEGWPALPEIAAGNHEYRDALVALWRRALTGPMTSRRAWTPMLQWLLLADRDPELAAFVEAMALDVFRGALAQRALFNLTIWRKRNPKAGLIETLYHRLKTTTEAPTP